MGALTSETGSVSGLSRREHGGDHTRDSTAGFSIPFFGLGVCTRSPSLRGLLTRTLTQDLIWIGSVPSSLLRWGIGSYQFPGSGPPGVGSGVRRPHGSQNGWHSLHSHRRQRGDRTLCHLPQLDGTSAGCRQYRSPHPAEANRGLGRWGVRRSAGVVAVRDDWGRQEVSRDQLCLPLPESHWASRRSYRHHPKQCLGPGSPPQNTQSSHTRHPRGAPGLHAGWARFVLPCPSPQGGARQAALVS